MTDEVELAYTKREEECIRAASRLLENSINNEVIQGFGGMALDRRVHGRNLLVEIAHDKYRECVATPSASGDQSQKSR